MRIAFIMDNFEEKLRAATAKDTGYMLGAIGIVTDARGNVLYHHSDGRQDIEHDSPPIDPNSAISWSAATKFMPNLAALLLVQKGLVTLDEPIGNHLPDINILPVISRATQDSDQEFVVRKPNKSITIRHLMTHTAGLDTPQNELAQEFLTKNPFDIPEDAATLVKLFSTPLLFDPGEGFLYGCCVYWLQHLVNVMAGNFQTFVQENIFKPLGMTNVTYVPEKVAEVWDKRLRMVEQVDGKFIPFDEHSRGHTCSPLQLSKLLADLISPNSKLLRNEYRDILLKGQLERGSSAHIALSDLEENYGFVANKADHPEINFTSLGVYIANSTLVKSGIPGGSLFMDGGFGTVWVANKERGIMAIFATQMLLYGVSDDVMLAFMQNVFATFSGS